MGRCEMKSNNPEGKTKEINKGGLERKDDELGRSPRRRTGTRPNKDG